MQLNLDRSKHRTHIIRFLTKFLNHELLKNPSRDIIFLGEGNFTFARAFAQRYPGLTSRMVASDVELRKDCTSVRNQEYLKSVG